MQCLALVINKDDLQRCSQKSGTGGYFCSEHDTSHDASYTKYKSFSADVNKNPLLGEGKWNMKAIDTREYYLAHIKALVPKLKQAIQLRETHTLLYYSILTENNDKHNKIVARYKVVLRLLTPIYTKWREVMMKESVAGQVPTMEVEPEFPYYIPTAEQKEKMARWRREEAKRKQDEREAEGKKKAEEAKEKAVEAKKRDVEKAGVVPEEYVGCRPTYICENIPFICTFYGDVMYYVGVSLPGIIPGHLWRVMNLPDSVKIRAYVIMEKICDYRQFVFRDNRMTLTYANSYVWHAIRAINNIAAKYLSFNVISDETENKSYRCSKCDNCKERCCALEMKNDPRHINNLTTLLDDPVQNLLAHMDGVDFSDIPMFKDKKAAGHKIVFEAMTRILMTSPAHMSYKHDGVEKVDFLPSLKIIRGNYDDGEIIFGLSARRSHSVKITYKCAQELRYKVEEIRNVVKTSENQKLAILYTSIYTYRMATNHLTYVQSPDEDTELRVACSELLLNPALYYAYKEIENNNVNAKANPQLILQAMYVVMMKMYSEV